MDFPYNKRTQIMSKSSKVTLTRTTRAGTSGPAWNFRAQIISSSPLALNLSYTTSDDNGPKSKVVDLAMKKNSSVDHFFIRGHLDVEIGPENLQTMLKFQFSGRTACKVPV